MWEIAVLIIAIAVLLLVVFIIPVLLQVRDSAKELELTLRETRATMEHVRQISAKAEAGIDQGLSVISRTGQALEVVDNALGGRGLHFVGKTLGIALEVVPVMLTARKLYAKFTQRR